MLKYLFNIFPAALHAHAEGSKHEHFAEMLVENFGRFGSFLDEVVLHGIIATLQIAIFLFCTYLIIGFIEHKTSHKATSFMQNAGNYGAILGGLFGVIPQCGFSAAAANLYTGRVITVGTLVAVFLSTSDEMLPILLAGKIKFSVIVSILLYKMIVGILVGLLIDFVLKIVHKKQIVKRDDGEITHGHTHCCCECEGGILKSSLKHTLNVSLYILFITWIINSIIFFVGEEKLSEIFVSVPVLSHLICAVVGLIPNCAVSVVLTQFAISGFITSGAMLSGLFAGAGVGILVLYKTNRNLKENLIITSILIVAGVIFGLIADFVPFLSVL